MQLKNSIKISCGRIYTCKDFQDVENASFLFNLVMSGILVSFKRKTQIYQIWSTEHWSHDQADEWRTDYYPWLLRVAGNDRKKR